MAIPRTIHFFWTDPNGGDRDPPEDMQYNVREWAKLHPEFEVRIWGPVALETDANDVEGVDVKSAVRACRFEAMKSDIARLAIIYKHGGVYNDLKNFPVRPFLAELIETSDAVITEHPPTVANYAGRVCNAFFAGPPSHQFLFACLKLACRNVESRINDGVIATTGAGVQQRILGRPNGGTDVRIVPSVLAWGPQGGQGGWMRRTSASYNAADMKDHWSVRQRAESLYLP